MKSKEEIELMWQGFLSLARLLDRLNIDWREPQFLYWTSLNTYVKKLEALTGIDPVSPG